MKLVFISNYISHHQKPFCDAMKQKIGKNFIFMETMPMEKERLDMGWEPIRENYVFRTYESNESEKKAKKIAVDAEIVILGSASDNYIIPRLKTKKLTFKYAERFYKTGLTLRNLPHAAAGAWLHHGRFQRYPLYMLCASAYTPADAAIFHNYVGRTYKWGYFPEVKRYDMAELMEKKQSAASVGEEHSRISILWAGRLIGWKHPEAAVQLAASLKEKGYSFRMSMIGNGEMKMQLHDMIREKGLEDCVEMLGAMPPEEVRRHMEKADIYLFTSDFNEGWGAVLNESMNSGCAVVASHAIGSVPFLIKNGENGLIYENGNQLDLEKQVLRLLEDGAFRKKIAENAYETMINLWNAETAAERFLTLTEKLLKNENTDSLFRDGPCSKAAILKNDWYQH